VTADALDRLHVEMARCPFHDVLRPEGIRAGDGMVVVRLPFRPEFRLAADGDCFHGGVLAALVDITAHATVAVQTGHVSPTVDLRLDYLRAARGDAMTATGRVLRVGRSIARADVEVRDPSGAVVVAGRGTFSTLRVGHGSETEGTV
jgi:uncharacterized protein (TIGR00369 family)